MTIKQHKDGTWIALERRDGIVHICQGSTQSKAYYALRYKLDQLFQAKADRMIEEARDVGNEQ